MAEQGCDVKQQSACRALVHYLTFPTLSNNPGLLGQEVEGWLSFPFERASLRAAPAWQV